VSNTRTYLESFGIFPGMYSGLEALLTEASSGPGTNAALVTYLLSLLLREEEDLLNNNCCCLFLTTDVVVVVFELDAKELD